MSNIARRQVSSPAKKAPPKKSAAKQAPAKKAVAEKAPAKKAPAKKAPAKKAPTKRAAAKKAPAKKAAPKKAGPKKVAGKKARPSHSGHERSATTGKSRKALPAPSGDPLLILGLTDPYTVTDLRRSWRTYARRHHPDNGGDAATFARGLTAYEALARRLQ